MIVGLAGYQLSFPAFLKIIPLFEIKIQYLNNTDIILGNSANYGITESKVCWISADDNLLVDQSALINFMS
jgi:hypothetical protein